LQSPFISLTMDEVTAIDSSHLLGMHTYYVKGFECMCTFVGLGKIGERATAVELTKLIIELLLKKCNLTALQLARFGF
jgi:hypothetical protein